MDNVSILPVKPGTLNDDDKAALRGAGIVVIEHENPAELRLLQPTADVPASGMLACAMDALCGPHGDQAVRSAFTRALGAEILKARKAS